MSEGIETEKGESIKGSPFCSDNELFNSLPVFFHPYHDESTLCWIHRLAHANCLQPHELFNADRSSTRLWSPDALIANHYHKLINIGQWDKGINLLPKRVSFFIDRAQYGLAGLFTSKHRYCPQCIQAQKEVYERIEWTYPWSNHCLVHHIPLLESCPQCHEPSPLYQVDQPFQYKCEWGNCRVCGTSLTREDFPQSISIHERNKDIISPYVALTNELIAKAHDDENDYLFVSMLLLIAFTLQYCDKKSHRRVWAYDALIDSGVNPCDFVCCPNPDINEYLGFPTSIPFEAALAMTWHLWLNSQDTFLRLIDEDWLPTLFPIPHEKVWIPEYLASKSLPPELYKGFCFVKNSPSLSKQLFGGKGIAGGFLAVLSLYESGSQWDKVIETIELIDEYSLNYQARKKEEAISQFQGTISADIFYHAASENTLLPSP